MNPIKNAKSRSRIFTGSLVGAIAGFVAFSLGLGTYDLVRAQTGGAATITATTTVVTQSDADRLAITVDQTQCPSICQKSGGRCDRSCRQRYYGELGTMEMINLRESRALSNSTPIEVAVIDQSKFCAKETVQFSTPAGPVNLTNPQDFKGAFSDHGLCNASYGYSTAYVPPPQPYPPYDVTSITGDGCYEVVNRYEREVAYNPPTIVGPVRYTCKEDNANKTVSWQLTRGCTVSWSGFVRNTGVVNEISRVQVGCFALQPGDPGYVDPGYIDPGGGDGSGGAY